MVAKTGKNSWREVPLSEVSLPLDSRPFLLLSAKSWMLNVLCVVQLYFHHVVPNPRHVAHLKHRLLYSGALTPMFSNFPVSPQVSGGARC